MLKFLRTILNIESNKSIFVKKLSGLGINPDEYFHDMFQPVSISFEDKLRGLIKHSTDTFSNGIETYKITLKDFKDGSNEVEFYYHGCGVEKCADVINKYYSFFDYDSGFNKEFTIKDHSMYRIIHDSQSLRHWKIHNYEIFIGNGSRTHNSCFIKCVKKTHSGHL